MIDCLIFEYFGKDLQLKIWTAIGDNDKIVQANGQEAIEIAFKDIATFTITT